MCIMAFIADASTLRDILAPLGAPTARGLPLWDLPDAAAGSFDRHAQPAPEYEFDQRIAW